MESEGLATATYWAPVLETVADIAFAVVIVALAVELVSGRLAKRFERQIDVARELHISQLEKETAEAKLALARLSTPLAELLKKPGARDQLIGALKEFAGVKFDTGLSGNSGEQADFLWVLRPILQDAGWKLLPWKSNSPISIPFGDTGLPVSGMVAAQNVEIHLAPQSRDALKGAADRLMNSRRLMNLPKPDMTA